MAEEADAALRLQTLLQSGQWLDARALAHRWHGAAGNLALPRLARAAQALERALQQPPDPELPALAGALDEALHQALGLIAEQQGESRPVPLSPAPSPAQLLEQLDLLAQALSRHELHDGALQHLQTALPAARIAVLVEAVELFDFDAALRALQALRSELESA